MALVALASSDAELAEAAEVRAEDLSLARAWLRRFGGPVLDALADALPFERETVSLAIIATMLGQGSRYIWLTRQASYFDLRRRQVILPADVRRSFDAALDRAADQARTDTLSLLTPQASLADWELTMRRQVKDSQVSAAILANGGVRRLSVGALTEVTDDVQAQFGYLSRFAVQIEEAAQPIDGRAAQRAEAYLQSARSRYMRSRADVAQSAGYDQRRNILYPGDSCEGCVAMTAKEWTAIDDPEYVPIGDRQCIYNCRCDEVFRNSETGEIDHVPSSFATTGVTEWGPTTTEAA